MLAETQVFFFLAYFFFIPVSKTDVPDDRVSFLGKNWGLI